MLGLVTSRIAAAFCNPLDFPRKNIESEGYGAYRKRFNTQEKE
jgi:hypothetical protein